MKKPLILLLFLKFLIISDSSFSDDEFLFKAKCESPKAKTGACFYEMEDSKGNEIYAIFDTCGKGKRCSYDGVCVEDLKKIKYGKSCNYNEDCLSGSCISGKCGGAIENQSCDNIGCEPGLKCYYSYTSSNTVKKCVKPVGEGSKADNTYCMNGLIKDKDGICRKYGTLPDKTVIYVGADLLCESGLAHYANNDYICDSLETEPECGNQVVKKAGKWSDGTDIPVTSIYYNYECKSETDYTGKEIYYYKYSKLQSKLYKEFINEYKSLDLDKFNSEEGSSFHSGKIGEKFFLYENAPALQAAGIIDSQGEVVDDKKCIFDFRVKLSNSIFIKLKPIILAIIALLF